MVIILCCNFIFLHANELESIINQGKKLFDDNEFVEALNFLNSKENEFENANGDIKAQFWTLIGQTYLQLRNISEAEKALLKSISFSENKENENYANTLHTLGNIYYSISNLQQAETYWLEAKALREKILGNQHPDYARSLNNLAVLYSNRGDFSTSEKYLLEVLSIEEKVLGKETIEYAHTLNNLGNLYRDMGNYPKAEIYYLEVKNISEKILGNQHPEYARSLNNLGVIYNDIGDYQKSEIFYLESKTIFEKVFGKEHPEYAHSLNNLGVLYFNMGDYQKSEKYYIEAKDLRKKIFRTEHLDYAGSLGNLGGFYHNIGDYPKAEIFYLETKEILEKILGKEHPLYASSLNNLGALYNNIEDFSKAEIYFSEAKDLREKVLGNEHPDYIASLYNLGVIYYNIGDFSKAEHFYLEAKNIREKVLGKEHKDFAQSLNKLGELYIRIENFSKSEKYFLEAIKIREKLLGNEHPDYLTSLNNLAIINFVTKNFHKAENLKIEADKITINIIENNFLFLSERQRELYWNLYKEDFETTFSCNFSYPSSILTTQSYNNILFTKGLLLRTTNGIRDIIYSSNDADLIEQYDFLKSNRLSLNALKQQENPNFLMISILEATVDSLDKSLTQKSAEYRDFTQEIKWSTIRDLLQEDEAAIEFVHFRMLDDKAKFSDTIIYCALLLKKDIENPLWIPLFKENDLLELSKREKNISDLEFTQQLYSEKGPNLYDLIWKPIEKELDEISTIYYAPTGTLHQISFAAVPVSFNHKGTQSDFTKTHKDTSQLLSHKYNLHLLTSTREILSLKKEVAGSLPKGSAAIYGGLFYEPENYETKNSSTYSQLSILNSQFSNNSERGLGIRQKFLPGTEKEAELIVKYLNESQIDSRLFLYSAGSEETFKQLSGTETGIIHISTHGFFFEDIEEHSNNDLSNLLGSDGRSSKTLKNRLLRSGLMFTDSNRAWTGAEIPEGSEDGILSADEIAQMNLVNTKLVVLSACETGLGEAKTAEGVFGLQRAFKLAGVETIIMSLWKVPDNATADLMTFFYQNWLSGNSKQQAFAEAQKQVREKYNDAYYWAGFVMLD